MALACVTGDLILNGCNIIGKGQKDGGTCSKMLLMLDGMLCLAAIFLISIFIVGSSGTAAIQL
eukprot:4314105-Karenia_brevis.AAC.1